MEAENIITPNQIRVHSGLYLDPTNLTTADITLDDIAHGLSHRCRFTGHTRRFYSVAEHSLRVAELVPAEHRLAALLHDASEAYLFDMPAPVKHLFPNLIWLEESVLMTIFNKFALLDQWPLHASIKQADKRALEEEWTGLIIGDNYQMGHREPKNAKAAWLFAVNGLLAARRKPLEPGHASQGMVQEGGES